MKLHEGTHVFQAPNGEVEICAGMETLLRLSPQSPARMKLLNSLVAGCSRADFNQQGRTLGVSARQLEQLLEILNHADLLNPKGSYLSTHPDLSAWQRVGGNKMTQVMQRRAELSVGINRLDRLGQLIALTLSGAGLGTIRIPEGAKTREHGLDYRGSRSASIKEMLSSRQLSTKVITGKTATNLEVFIDWGFPNPLRVLEAMHQNQAHLQLTLGHDYVDIGPLVIPGTTPCVSCMTHRLGDAIPDCIDRAIGLNTVQYPRIESVLAAGAASLACTQIFAYLDKRALRPGIVTRLDIDGATWTLGYEFHPECGCTPGNVA